MVSTSCKGTCSSYSEFHEGRLSSQSRLVDLIDTTASAKDGKAHCAANKRHIDWVEKDFDVKVRYYSYFTDATADLPKATNLTGGASMAACSRLHGPSDIFQLSPSYQSTAQGIKGRARMELIPSDPGPNAS